MEILSVFWAGAQTTVCSETNLPSAALSGKAGMTHAVVQFGSAGRSVATSPIQRPARGPETEQVRLHFCTRQHGIPEAESFAAPTVRRLKSGCVEELFQLDKP